jgi:hypothetical protein
MRTSREWKAPSGKIGLVRLAVQRYLALRRPEVVLSLAMVELDAESRTRIRKRGAGIAGPSSLSNESWTTGRENPRVG